MALCHVLLKTYGPNDVLLLASLFAMEDKTLEEYYGNDIMSEFPSTLNTKGDDIDDAMFLSNCNLFLVTESKNKVQVELPLVPFLVKIVGVLRPKSLKFFGRKTLPLENGEINHVLYVIPLMAPVDRHGKSNCIMGQV